MARRKRRLTKAQAKAFLETEKGRAWLERKIEKRNRSRPDPGPHPDPSGRRTRFPFRATIAGRECIVWLDWIEYEEGE